MEAARTEIARLNAVNDELRLLLDRCWTNNREMMTLLEKWVAWAEGVKP